MACKNFGKCSNGYCHGGIDTRGGNSIACYTCENEEKLTLQQIRAYMRGREQAKWDYYEDYYERELMCQHLEKDLEILYKTTDRQTQGHIVNMLKYVNPKHDLVKEKELDDVPF